MSKRRNWLKKTIAMLTLVATVLETGFSSVVPVFAAEISTEDSRDAVISDTSVDTGDDVLTENSSTDDGPTIEVITGEDSSQDIDDASEAGSSDIMESSDEENKEADEADEAGKPEDAEVTAENKESKLDVTDNGIIGSGYSEVSIYVDTEKLDKKDRFFIKFTGPDSATYNPVINDDLDATNGGRYDFEDLEGSDFSIRATSSDDVILSYKYNEDGIPTIVAESKEKEKVLNTRILTAVDDSKISAIEGEGYDSITVKLDTEDLSDKDTFKLYVESNANATVDGRSAISGISGLTKSDDTLTIENLDKESFIAYVVSDTEAQIEAVAEIIDVESGEASIDINGVATKRVYEYEDSKVYVRATLEKADAVPDDAYFAVEPLDEEEAEKYLAELNENKDEDMSEYTAENTLLYDIGFYTDESKSEEIEPEEGAVRIAVEFKNDQLEEDLGVTSLEDVEVTHFVEDGSVIGQEKLDVDTNAAGNTVEVVTESFSKFAFRGNGKGEVNVSNPGNESSQGVLSDAWLYGITANRWEFDGESETSFAVGTLKSNGGQTGVNASKAKGSFYQYDMVGDVEGAGTGIKGYDAEVTIPRNIQNKIWSTGGVNITYKNRSKEAIQQDVSSMINYVQLVSERLYGLDSLEKYTNLPQGDNANKLVMDITNAPDGTYYVQVDKYPALKKAIETSDGLKLVKNSTQKVVFNFGGTSVTTDKFTISQGGTDYQSTVIADMSSAQNPIVEDIFFNMPNATEVYVTSFAGIMMAPKATVNVGNGASGGWLVCNVAKTGSEWHFVNGRIPNPEPGNATLKIPVNKRFIGGTGKWNDGFEFKIEKRRGNSGYNWVPVEDVDLNEVTAPDVKTYIPNIKIAGGQSEEATGEFNINYNNRILNSLGWTPNGNAWYDGYEDVAEEWYRISEIKGNRKDVEYNYHPAWENGYQISDYWYVHVFIYKDRSNNKIEYKVVKRTARVNPETFNWNQALPCEEDGPIWFINKHKPVDVPVTFEGIKYINDSCDFIAEDNTFEFTLYKYVGGNKFEGELQKTWNVGNRISFDPITLNLGEGTENNPQNDPTESKFYFLIKETGCKTPYIKDESSFIAKVIVTRNSNNTLSSSVEYYRFAPGVPVDVTRAMGQGDSTIRFSTAKCGTAKFGFYNKFEPTGEAVINGLKTFEGRDFDDDDTFTFILSSTDDTQVKANQTKTFRIGDIKAQGRSFNFSFDKLEYSLKDAGKTYHYTVTEKKGDDNNISYDGTPHNVTIKITANKTDKLDIDQKGGVEPIEFTNVYSAKGDVVFKAEKVYPFETDKEFTFYLEGGKSDGTAQISQVKTITGAGTVFFDTINFADTNAVGTYNYSIWEDIPEGAVTYNNDPTKKIFEGVIYDARVYHVTVEVTDNKSGVLQKNIYGAYDNAEMADITEKGVDPEFKNDYKVDVVEIQLRGEKSLPGQLFKRGAFKFDLAAYGTTVDAAKSENGAVVMPAKTSAYNGIPEDKLSVNEFVFDKIKFTQPGTYQFSITEDKKFNPIENVVYSEDQFIVTVTVTDNGKGKLVATSNTTINGTTDKVDAVRFINTPYNPGEVPVIAKKILKGKKLQKDQFEFQLIYGGKVLQTRKNDETGYAKFDNLQFALKDLWDADTQKYLDTKTFQYTIKEVLPEGVKYDKENDIYKLNGITYDTHEEIVNVTISKDKDKNGNAIIKVVSDNAYTGKYATFTNEYYATGKLEFGGNKIISGRSFNEKTDKGQWFADLYEEGNPKPIRSAEITKDTSIWGKYSAEFNFDPIVYVNDTNEPFETKVFNYTVKERGNVKNVTNSKMVYEIEVTVTDNGKGELIVTPNYKKGKPTFINTFEAENSVSFQAYKEVSENKVELKDRMFDFSLTDVTDPAKPKVVQTVENYGAQITFDPIKYNQDDVAKSPFVYKINEVTKNKKGWKLSEEEFTAKAFLTYNEDTQEIDIVKKYYKTVNGKEVKIDEAKVVFVNDYNAEGSVVIPVKKNLVDKELKAGQFLFDLYAEDDLNKPIQTVSNNAAAKGEYGTATFAPIKYTIKDFTDKTTYKIGENQYKKIYVVKERIPEGAVEQNDGTWKFEGYTYDGSAYYVEVLLEDKGDGTIKTNWLAYQSGTLPKTGGWFDKVIKFFKGEGEQPIEFVSANQNIIFTNTYAAEGAIDLRAKKVFTGKTLEKDAFTFYLEGKDESGQKFIYSRKNDESGMVYFNRIHYTKPGSYEYKIWENIPAGATEENNYTLDGVKYDPTVYTINVDVTDSEKGTLDVKAYIVIADQITPVATSVVVTDENGKEIGLCAPEAYVFTNTYVPTEVTIVPGGIKTLDGRPIKDEEFEFTLQGKEGNPKGTTPEVVKNYGNAFTFSPITFTPDDMLENGIYVHDKTFEYTLKEVRGSLPGVTYDSAEYDIVVTVTNEKGVLTASITSNGIQVDQDKLAEFYNPYDANGSVSFRVHKTVKGVNTDKVFKFVLTDDETGAEYVAYCKANETKKIADFTYELANLDQKVNGVATKTYNYTCSEYVPTDDEDETAGWTFSQNVYKAVVVVTDNEDGTLDVDKKIYLNGSIFSDSKNNDDDTMIFENEYHAEGEVEVPGVKYLEGRDLTKGDFTFALGVKYDTDVDGNGKYRTIATTTNDDDGQFKFVISGFTQDDIGHSFDYRVSEVIPGLKDPDLIYDESVYDVTVTVKDAGKGKLDVKRVISKDGQILDPADPCTFRNKVVKSNSVSFNAIKSLEGLPLKNYMFTFSIAGDGKDNNNYYQEVTNDGKNVYFDDIQYGLKDAGKTYHYAIKEKVTDTIKGMTYSTIQYDAEVKVSLDKKNNLKVDKETRLNGTVVDGDMVFENKFEADVEVPLSGSKKLDGFPTDAPSIGKYTYYFDLYDENGNVIDTAEVTPKDSKTEVAYSFNNLKFNQDDMMDTTNPDHEFKYTVKERVPVYEKDKAPNVTYDETEYHITVKLFYDTGYELKAYATTDQGVATDNLKFTNKYIAEGEKIIDGIKTIEGKTLEDKTYTFELTHPDGHVEKVTNDGAQFSFKKLSFTADDIGKTYTYKVTESMTTGDNSNPDTTEYYVDLTINEGTGKKVIVDRDDYVLDENGQKQAVLAGKIEFHNTYEANGEVKIDGIKSMHNRPLAKGEFWFILRDENGTELERVTHAAASLNNKQDLEARAAFEFSPLKFDQEVLKASDGSYMKEVHKFYTVDEAIANKGGVKYSKAAYAIDVTIKDEGNGNLKVTKNVVGRNIVNKENNGLPDFLKSLFGKFADKEDEIIFENEYDSECTIDPPILRKQMVGQDIQRGEFEFKVTGPGLRSMNEKEYVRYVKNGINSVDGSYLFPNGEPMPEGEIYVGDIKYTCVDLVDDPSFTLEGGTDSRTFEYFAEEIDTGAPGVVFSDQKFRLVVTAIENGDGTISIKNGRGELVNDDKEDKVHKLYWEPVNPYYYNDEQMNDAYINTVRGDVSIDLPGIKKLNGRKITENDKFEFTITDDQTGAQVTTTNSLDKISFNAKDVSFLNYRYGAFDTNPDYKPGDEAHLVMVDDTGEHTYTISEKSVSSNSIKSDTSTYKVHVDVKVVRDEYGRPVIDNGKVKMEANVTKVDKVYTDNNKVAFDFANNNYYEFVNEFKATGKVEFAGTKYIKKNKPEDAKDKNLSLEGKYSFALYQYDDASRTTGKKLIDSQTTDKNGSYKLTVPEYDQDVLKNEQGEYEDLARLYYRIVETKPSNGTWTEGNTLFESDGIIYDNTEYDVNVIVEYDGTPNLKVEKKIVKSKTGEEVQNVDFFNVEVEVAEYTEVSGNKIWIDGVKDPTKRPDITIDLYSSAVESGKKVINSVTLTKGQTHYEFKEDSSKNPLPKYDDNGKLIKYDVDERPVEGYVKEKKGFDIYNTKGHVVIQKLDLDTREPLAGATLAIYDGSKQVEKWVSETSAHILEATLTPGKSYTLRELSAPEGYEVAEDITFTAPADGTDITVTMEDRPVIGSVRLTKRDSATRETLAGAEFALYTSEGTRIYATGSAGSYTVTKSTSNGVFATNSSGILEINELPRGAYYFVETKAPEGYKLSSERVSFTISKYGEMVEVTYLNSGSLGSVKLTKVGEAGTRGLAGAVFELYAKTPRTIGQAAASTVFSDSYYRYGTYTTNSSGEIYVSGLPWDDYYFLEVKAPDGYEIAKDISGDPLVYTFTISADNAGATIDLGTITNERVETGVLGERREPESGVLGVRSAPKKGVLGTRVGPATGDASGIALWLTLMVACIGTIIWMLASKRKKGAQ